MNTIDNFAIVVYTNEAYIPILRLFLDELYALNPEIQLPVYVMANKLPDDVPYKEKITYLDTNVPWNYNGNHFSSVVKEALPRIKEEYIFWFCEDYLLTDNIEMDKLNNLLRFVRDKQLDIFTFGSVFPSSGCEKIDGNYASYGFEGETFYYVNHDYMHKFNVQPGIWKKDSLYRLVTENDISLHDLDCSNVINSDTYTAGCTTYKIFDSCPTCPQKFIISYIEIVRHGVLQFTENGLNVDKVYNDYLKRVALKYNIQEKEEYNRFIGFDKVLLTQFT